jgi:hypothetical protein
MSQTFDKIIVEGVIAYISKEERDKIPEDSFAGPDRSFPIRNQKDVDDAAKLIGKAKDPEAVKSKIKKIAKKKGLKIPKSWE